MNMQAKLAVQTHTPGEPGIWLLVFGDMVIYGLMFLIFAFAYQQQPDVFSASQQLLSQGFGVFNTLILLTSSWFVVNGVRAARAELGAAAARWFMLALLCGAAFVVNKVIEYGLKIQSGAVLTSNDFFMYYYLITGFHLLHVLIGMVVLFCMWRAARRPGVVGKDIIFMESGATFWHLVDLLWIAIFPLIYLLE